MQWDRILADAEKAQALPPGACADFLSTLETTTEHGGEVRRLLTRLGAGFLATSAGDAAAADALVGAPGRRIGPWRLDSLLGRGGMGEVWRARRDDGLYEQNAAVKLMQPGGPERARRFDNERRRLARMEHPGIARILDGGITEDGSAYMAMDLVEGVPLDQYAAGRPQREALRLLAETCDAVHHAHSRLILHRDLKPANILVDQRGQVRLIDFGIASALDDAESGGPLTLAYAAPEQLMGEALSVATDVFALGLVMHAVLTGALPPRNREGGVQVAEKIAGHHDLALIIRQATAAAPEKRYSSAEALAADVRQFLDHRPIAARRGQWAYRAGRNLRRYPLASALTGLTVATLIIGLVSTTLMTRRAEIEAARANAELQRAQFFLDRANLFNLAQNAYSDLLQRTFGNEADLERLTNVMMGRWREVHERRSESPETAALLSYAVGRHFLFRNDYPRAVEVFEPWVSERYGPPDLLGLGEHLLAITYLNLGLREEAIRHLRPIEEFYASGYERFMPDHVAVATQIASLTSDSDDIDRALNILDAAGLTDHGPQVSMFFANQRSLMFRLKGDIDAAHASMRDVVAIIRSNQAADISGMDTGLLNLAEYEILNAGDLALAEDLINEVLGPIAMARGESRESGRARMLLALLRMDSGELEAAEGPLDEALGLLDRFSGARSASYQQASLLQAELLQKRTQPEEAARILQALMADSDLPEAMRAQASLLLPATGDGARVSDAAREDMRRLASTHLYLRRLSQALHPD